MAEGLEDPPRFLEILDSDREGAWEAFYHYGMRLLASHRVLRWFPAEERRDLLHDFLCDCCLRSFRVLRQYREQGQGFDSWLYRVATNWLYDRSRTRKRMRLEPLDNDPNHHAAGGSEPEQHLSRQELWDKVRLCMSRLSTKCRILLSASIVDLLPPREMTILLRLPEEKNKEVSDMLRHCRRKLREALLEAGVEPSSLKAVI